MNRKLIYTLAFTLGGSIIGLGQTDIVKFGAISRGLIQESKLANDTVNTNRSNSGNALIDLRVNINPNKKTEIGTVIRMNAPLGGFYGWENIQLRQLFLKGTVANTVNYELGDIYLKLSPYTLYNTNAEGNINEASVFSDIRKDYSYYENFNIGNNWWSHGGHVDFGISLDSMNKKGVHFDAFTTRVTSLGTMRFLSGGRASLFNKNSYNLNLNLVQLFDALKINREIGGIKNSVASLEASYVLPIDRNSIEFSAEGGLSTYEERKALDLDAAAAKNLVLAPQKEGNFFSAKATFKTHKDHFKIGLKYARTNAEFLSAGAQSKRINFTSSPDLFTSVGKDPLNSRNVQLYDLLADPNIYTPVISPVLMAYNPKYGNALPYGTATPNRNGVYLDASYKDSASVVELKMETAILSEVSGVSTTQKRAFLHNTLEANLYVNKLIGFKRMIKLSAGTLYNKTTRNLSASSVALDLTSFQLDAGIDVEVVNRLFVLVGIKSLAAKGNESLSAPADVTPSIVYNVNSTESILGLGMRYQFSDNMYLSVRNLSVESNDKNFTQANYSFNQWMLLFSLKL